MTEEKKEPTKRKKTIAKTKTSAERRQSLGDRTTETSKTEMPDPNPIELPTSEPRKDGNMGARQKHEAPVEQAALRQRRLPTLSLSTLAILFLVSFILVLSQSMYDYWPVTYLGWVGMTFSLLYGISFYTGEAARHSFESTTALVSAMALAAAVYWFFYERPGVPKLELTPVAQIWPIEGNRVVLRVVVRIENVGSTVLNFENYQHDRDEMEINVGQVIPIVSTDKITKKLLDEYDKRFSEGKTTFGIVDRNDLRNNFWPMKGREKTLPVGEIESGEAQEYFYSGIFDCKDNMVLIVNVKIPKKYDSIERFQNADDQTLYWMGEAVSTDEIKCIN